MVKGPLKTRQSRVFTQSGPGADASTAVTCIMLNSAITLRTMKNFLITASGTAAGTLISTSFVSSAQEPDWGRAAFVGIFCGVGSAIWPKKKRER